MRAPESRELATYSIGQDGVARITLNRPQRSNALDLATVRALRQAVERARDEPGLRAVHLSGAGPRFCVGGDVRAFALAGDDVTAYIGEVATELHRTVAGIADMPAPVAASVHGCAAGAGLALALACDITIAASSATFVLAYPALGLTPDGGASWHLPRQLGLRRAIALAMTDRHLSADEADRLGMVTQVCADEDLPAVVGQVLDRLAAGPTAVLVETRRLMTMSVGNTLQEHLDLELDALATSSSAADGREGLTAFSEGRTTRFGAAGVRTS